MEAEARRDAEVRIRRATVVQGGEAVEREEGDEVARRRVVLGPVFPDGQVVVARGSGPRDGGGSPGDGRGDPRVVRRYRQAGAAPDHPASRQAAVPELVLGGKRCLPVPVRRAAGGRADDALEDLAEILALREQNPR